MRPTRRAIGLLTVPGYPLLPAILASLRSCEDIEPVLLFDAKGFSQKDRRIFHERTGGAFEAQAPSFDAYRQETFMSHDDPACRASVRAQRIALLVNAGTPRKLTLETIQSAPLGVLNVHPGLLPAYRGATCCEWAIWNDDPVGVTAHLMNEEFDGGPILFSRTLAVAKGQRYTDIRVALYRLSIAAYAEAIRGLLDATLQPIPQEQPGPVRAPMPEELLAQVKAKLEAGVYACAI